MVKPLLGEFEIVNGVMTTVHAVTMSQNLLDNPHKDLRRARTAMGNIVPTTTGAARALSEVLPQMTDKLDGYALRVPVHNVSLVDLVVNLAATAEKREINEVFRRAARGSLEGIVRYEESELVSSDFVGTDASVVIDAASTLVVGNMAKIFGWYDNEWGYSCRVADLAALMGCEI